MEHKKPIITFLLMTLLLSAVINIIWISGGDAATKSGISILLMWCPGVSAIIVRRIYYKNQSLLGVNKCSLFYIIAAIVLPLIYLGVSYCIYWLISKGSFVGNLNTLNSIASGHVNKDSNQFVVTIITLVVSLLSSIFAATGEEIGWRGFLLPQLTKIYSTKTAIIVSGVIWGLWHTPLIIAGIYNPGTPLWYQLPMFFINIITFSVIISILRLKSKSLWPAILIHAFHNHFDQAIFMQLTNSANKAYFVGETGIITTITLILLALGLVLFYKKNRSIA